MIRTLRLRLAARSLELELLITACLLLLAGLATLIVRAGGMLRWSDMAIVGALWSCSLLSLALALRGWGEDQVLLRSRRCWPASAWWWCGGSNPIW